MIKQLFLAIFFSFILVTPCLANNIMEKMDEVSIQIDRCTGVLVGTTDKLSFILTAKHCTVDDMLTRIQGKFIIEVVTDSKQDLAVLIVKGHFKDKKVVTLNYRDVVLDDVVYHLGYPGVTKGDTFYNTGKVVILRKEYYYSDMNIYIGCSGGGIFTKYGLLVGTAIKLNHIDHVSVFENLPNIKRLLKKYNIPFKE